ncbi:MAG: NAD(P)-dependent oxidoreductase [Rhodospirillales bacterium]
MDDGTAIAAGRLGAADYSKNFDEVKPPLDRHQAIVESSRCLFCYDAPCVEACPTGIDIPNFIRKIGTGNLKGSALDILSANIMGGMCARVCPTEVLCEQACVRMEGEGEPVKIGLLQRHATDWLLEQGIQPFSRAAPSGKTVAVVGGGPAGLSCSHRLAMLGHRVTVFDARTKLAGLNEYGIAAYKTPHHFAQREVDFILGIGGIDTKLGRALGRDITLDGLRQEFDAVFLAIGLPDTKKLEIPGEELSGVEDAVDYIAALRQADDLSRLPIGRRIVVIGGGNTAIDIAVQAKRLGAEDVTLVYRRGPETMSATHHEQEFAQTNGVRIKHWAKPVRLIGEGGRVTSAEFEYTEMSSGKLVDTGRNFTVPADQVFKAIGQAMTQEALRTAGLETLNLRGGKIAVDGAGQTSLPNVWAGGDCISGIDLTVQAVQDGKLAAHAIDRHLRGD